MSIPSADLEAPERVRALARGDALTPVWKNGIGRLTFSTDDARFIKRGPLDPEANMRDEAERMHWAHRWTRVPEVLEQGEYLPASRMPPPAVPLIAGRTSPWHP